MSKGYVCNVKTTLNIHRVLYISSTSTSVHLIGFTDLANPVFNISNITTSSVSYVRIA